MNRSLIPLCALLLSLVACSTSSPASLATPTSLFSGAPSPVPSTIAAITPEAGSTVRISPTLPPSQAGPQFTVAVIVDKATQSVTREQAEAVIVEASGYLREFSPIGLLMTDFIEENMSAGTADMVNRYMAAHAAALPDGLLIFSFGDQGQAKKDGGYGFSVPAPAEFKNPFVSPVAGSSQMYVAVVDYSYKYMACGYGGSDTASSAVALAGECRGQTGVTCVQGSGYSMCANATGNLYTSTPTHAVASMIVHSLLHNFASLGEKDNYATPECNARMGYPEGFFDLQESEYYNGLCPFEYEEFTKAYRP